MLNTATTHVATVDSSVNEMAELVDPPDPPAPGYPDGVGVA